MPVPGVQQGCVMPKVPTPLQGTKRPCRGNQTIEKRLRRIILPSSASSSWCLLFSHKPYAIASQLCVQLPKTTFHSSQKVLQLVAKSTWDHKDSDKGWACETTPPRNFRKVHATYMTVIDTWAKFLNGSSGACSFAFLSTQCGRYFSTCTRNWAASIEKATMAQVY